MRIYMDVCCLCRPYDNQHSDRIKLESEAVLLILFRCQQKDWRLIGSDIIDVEISKIVSQAKKQKVSSFVELTSERIEFYPDVEVRSSLLRKYGIDLFDSLHIASAEKAKADVFLTTDDELIKNVKRVRDLKVMIENPVKWLMEVMNNETDNQRSGLNKKNGI